MKCWNRTPVKAGAVPQGPSKPGNGVNHSGDKDHMEYEQRKAEPLGKGRQLDWGK